MFNDFKSIVNEIYNIILQPIDIIYKTTAIDKYKRKLGIENNSNFSNEYYKNVGTDKEKGIVYTPEEIAFYMIKNSINTLDIINNPFLKIVDPACGGGNLIIPCFVYLKEIFSSNLSLINEKNNLKLTLVDIDKHIIDNNLYGLDIDIIALRVLMIDLFMISGQVNEKNFSCCDFLTDDINLNFDIFIGNPPYIGHKSISREYSKVLKDKYKGVYKDKGDVSYCFFKRALNMLNNKGKLTFITSRYFLEAPSGEILRKVLAQEASVYKIIDFYGIRPFKGVGIDPVIIFLNNDEVKGNEIEVIKPLKTKGTGKKSFYQSVFLNDGETYKTFFVSSKNLNHTGWRLIDENQRAIVKKIEEKSVRCLGDICNSYQGIITGCDKAFVIDSETIVKENIERDIIRPWIKNSYIYRKDIIREDKFIIYSNLIKKEEDYPNAINYIKNYKDKLLSRRECKNGLRRWYELQWGRVQETFEKEKIVFPYKSNSNRFAWDRGSYFSADVYALLLKEDTYFSYDFLLYILNSKLYEFYFKTYAKKLGEDLFDYYPNNLNRLLIPHIPQYDGKQNEEFLYDFFDLTKAEIGIIEDIIT